MTNNMHSKNVPVCEAWLNSADTDAVANTIKQGWVSSEAPVVQQFESQFSGYIGTQFGVAVSSGTAALECALFALGVKEGDEVILPSFTIISCAIAVLRLGAIPVLVDAKPGSWVMNSEMVIRSITPKTRAIICVHIYCTLADVHVLKDISKKYAIPLVEDAAQAHGASYENLNAGTFGDVSCFSFYANKVITTGEGGMVLTDSFEVAERARSYRNLCFNAAQRYLHYSIGNNYRMTAMQAALGCSQLSRIQSIIKEKKRVGMRYRQNLDNVDAIELQLISNQVDSVYWMNGFVVNAKNFNRDCLFEFLKKAGIGYRPFFHGLHAQPALAGLIKTENNSFDVTEHIGSRGFYLPSSPTLTNELIDEICKTLLIALKNNL